MGLFQDTNKVEALYFTSLTVNICLAKLTCTAWWKDLCLCWFIKELSLWMTPCQEVAFSGLSEWQGCLRNLGSNLEMWRRPKSRSLVLSRRRMKIICCWSPYLNMASWFGDLSWKLSSKVSMALSIHSMRASCLETGGISWSYSVTLPPFHELTTEFFLWPRWNFMPVLCL